MYAFRTKGGAEFSYTPDFEEFDYANLSFFGPDKKSILFHLSLRQKKGLAAVNAKPDGVWGEETHIDVSLARQGDRVQVVFDEDEIQVILNNKLLFQFDEEFGAIDQIQWLSFTGGFDEDSFEIGGVANTEREGIGEILQSDLFEFSGWAIDTGLPTQDIELVIDGLDSGISFFHVSRPNIAARYSQADDMIGVAGSLPGRIWDAVGDQTESLTLQPVSNGITCGLPLEITKTDIASKIEFLAQKEGSLEDTRNCLLAVEHAYHAKIIPVLSEPAKQFLLKVGKRYGVSSFLEEEKTKPINQPKETKTQPDEVLINHIRIAYNRILKRTEDPNRIDILEEVLRDYPLPAIAQKWVVLSATEDFCAADEFMRLYDFASRKGIGNFEPSGNSWFDSAILPFVYAEGRLPDVRKILYSLQSQQNGWVLTPAIGWVVRNLVEDHFCGGREKDVQDNLYAFMSLIEVRMSGYWGRANCLELTKATVSMITKQRFMPDYLVPDIERFALKCYGLNPSFWNILLEKVSDGELPPLLQRGKHFFDQIQDYMNGKKADLQAALEFFEAYQCRSATRFRVELLGASDLLSQGSDSIFDHGDNCLYGIEDTLLRLQSFPANENLELDGLLGKTRKAMRSQFPKVQKSPYYDLQFQVSRETSAILTLLANDDAVPPKEELRQLLGRLSILAGPRTEFLGLGQALSLLEGMVRLGQEDLATHIIAWLSATIADLPPSSREGLFARPAIFQSLVSLARLSGSPVAAMALDLFPRFPARNYKPDPASADSALSLVDANPLFNTIVVVFSCKPFLSDRVEAMRRGWLSKLKALGIPYVVVVGDGDGRLEGDVVHLRAPDDYEGLPQKTLASVEWVYRNTPYAYMLKIDDDCFLDVDEFFHSLSYRKFDYYGRRLHRQKGQLDRTWHILKSTTERGRKELDKSPEPSEYADGGSGYVLSRKAMEAISKAHASPTGQQLIADSFMEDKMIGDLLKQQGISIGDEDYYVDIERRTFSTATPVSMWQNAFYAGPSSVVKVAHLDTHKKQAEALKRSERGGLFPKKIWPTHGPVALGYNSNLLELISDQAKLAKLNADSLAVVACVRNEMFMLPHFLRHYRALGVKSFLIADNCSNDGTREYLMEQPDVAVFSVDTEYSLSQYGVSWQMNIIANLRVGRWSLIADADELLVFRGWERKSLPKLLNAKEWKDVDAVRIYMLDMYPKGPLSETTFEKEGPFASAGFVEKEPFIPVPSSRGPYSNSSTVTSALRHRLIPRSRPDLFVAQKYALLKYMPWMRPSAGFHYVAEQRVAEQEMIFAHFKYNAQFRQKALDEVARGQHFNDAEEYRKYLDLMSEGREVIFEQGLSVPWTECAQVRRILDA